MNTSVQGDRASLRTEAPNRSFKNRKTQYVYSLVRAGNEWRIASLVEDEAAASGRSE